MDKIYDICCGIDVHKKLIVACLNHKRKKELREFGATTRELMELAEWLQKNECEIVAMESTGSYWKPLYNIMESYGLHAIVVNPAHMKAVPGRKTDVKDAEWIAELLQHGLLQPSYIPSKDQRELRELVQYRKSLVGERTRELNRLQKMLEGANIKLSGTVTNINGKSARKILEYILSGNEIDEKKYDEMYEEKLIAHNLRLVVYIAKKFDNTKVGTEDLISIGTIGLMKAINTFDASKSIKLATYASRCIENEILMYLRKNNKQKLEVSIDEPLNVDWDGNELLLSDILGTDEDVIYRDLETQADLKLLHQALKTLNGREKMIIELRFGLHSKDGEELTQKQVADLLGISQSYISRLEKKIMKRLHREMARQENGMKVV